MKTNNFIVSVLFLAVVLIMGCNDIDNYSVSPNHRLSFSMDTLSFDTVFSTVGSTTNYFMIYNRNEEALKIERIMLAGGGESGFRINVDGRKGDSFSDIPIWKEDSLYVAVEITVNPNEENQPFLICDSVVFLTNGVMQAVRLEAYGQNIKILNKETRFTKDTTLNAERPYLVSDTITIPQGITLSIDQGAAFHMNVDAVWRIKGTLKTNGKMQNPVEFRAVRLDHYTSLIPYDRIPAQWDGIRFDSSSFGNELNYTHIRNGINGLFFEASTPERKKITIANSRITNMSRNLVVAENCHIEAYNTEFSNAANYLMSLNGGIYRLAHCTMANFIESRLSESNGPRKTPVLLLSNNYPPEAGEEDAARPLYPLKEASFDNCIIDGDSYQETELMIVAQEHLLDGDDQEMNYRFNHCFIKTKNPIENERFIKTMFSEKSLEYLKTGKNEEDETDLEYDFRPAYDSPAIGMADSVAASKHPLDPYGVSRLSGKTTPSIGAYEYVPKKEK